MSHLTSEERQRLINSIPEATVFDAHKENIMPRAEGRSAAMLNELCQMDPSEKEQVQKKGHLKFKQELDNIDDSDDPLGVYVAYVDWILSHYHPGDTRGSNLLPTLKAATESFVDDVRYKQHPSYLKLWLEYANWVEEPVTIYRYLTGKDIGQSVALFYETYAGYLERKVQYDDAKNVFEHGISNNAMPRDRLERNYNKLKERIKQRKAVKPQHKERSEELKAAGRTTLGVKSSSDSPYSQPSNVYNRTQSLYGAPTQSSSSIGRDYSNTTRSKDTFRVFKEAAAPSTALPTSAPRQLNVRATQSENKVRPVPMAGAILKQAPFTPPPQTKKFSIYRDTESPSNTAPPSPTTLERGLSYASDASEPSIRKQPLSPDITRRLKKPKENPTNKVNQERYNLYKNQYIKTSDSRGIPEIIACFELAPDMSFEEMRASRYKRASSPTFWEEKTLNEQESIGEGRIEINDYSIRASSPTQTLTAETRFARDTMFSIFGSDSIREDEEDVTWTKKYQTFKPRDRRHVDENEYN